MQVMDEFLFCLFLKFIKSKIKFYTNEQWTVNIQINILKSIKLRTRRQTSNMPTSSCVFNICLNRSRLQRYRSEIVDPTLGNCKKQAHWIPFSKRYTVYDEICKVYMIEKNQE